MPSDFDNISIEFGRTPADFRGNMLHWALTPLWSLMAQRRPGAEASVVIMVFHISRIYTGPAGQGLKSSME